MASARPCCRCRPRHARRPRSKGPRPRRTRARRHCRPDIRRQDAREPPAPPVALSHLGEADRCWTETAIGFLASGDEAGVTFRERTQGLELVAACLAFPEMPHAMARQILGPFRKEDR